MKGKGKKIDGKWQIRASRISVQILWSLTVKIAKSGEKTRKGKLGKQNELGFQQLATIAPLTSLYGATERLKYPY
jgi:hypothetical protein